VRLRYGFFLGLGLLALPVGVARADAPQSRAVVVVDVAPDAVELDASKLCKAIGDELGMDAVASNDARAGQATGAVVVSVDHDAHQLVVTYRGNGEPITRRMGRPPARAAAARAPALLAGNLARNEASDLVAELRKKAPLRAPVTSTPAPTVQPDDGEQDAERLKDFLADYASRDRSRRVGVGWVFVGLGTAAMIGGGYWWSQIKSQRDAPEPVLLSLNGLACVGMGTIGLLAPTQFEQLANYYETDRASGRTPSLVREDVERLWTRYANTEHAQMRMLPWIAIAVGAMELTAGIVGRLVSSSGSYAYEAPGVGLVGAGTLLLLWNSEGPMESRLHEYQRSASHTVSFRAEF
jgi:hypothetical protein